MTTLLGGRWEAEFGRLPTCVVPTELVDSPEPSVDRAPVLIIDDDQGIREALQELLEDEAFAVATAENGLEALDRLHAGLRPCLILLDLMMPRMDGWAFRRQQMADPELRDIPVIVLSAAGVDKESAQAQFGDAELLRKPATVDGLLAAIRRFCSHEIRG